MIYKDKIAANSKIRGSKGLYDCWEFRFSELSYLDGNSFIPYIA